MARTHGTRSTYNAGCRCDNCRVASRAARARQRAVASGQSEPSEALGAGWALVGLLGVAGGGYALWHAVTMQRPAEGDVGAFRRTRWRWCVGGAVLVGAGVYAFSRSG